MRKILILSAVLLSSTIAGAEDYVIQRFDRLGIKFFYNPTLNEEVTVRPDGRISLQLIDEVVAEGLTPAALADKLRELYSAEMDRPEISVIVRTFAAQRVYVDGEVEKPGELPLDGRLTVRQAIARAGGATDRAKMKEIVVIRKREDGTPTLLRVDARDTEVAATVTGDTDLQASDIVFVSRKAISDVNIWIDQYIRKNIPITVSLGYRYDLSEDLD